MRPNVLLDIDGVLADFIGGLIKRFGAPADWDVPRQRSEVASELLGITDDVWINRLDVSFWENLDTLPWAYSLVEQLLRQDYNLYLVTSAGYAGPYFEAAVVGKQRWVLRHFGEQMCRNTVFAFNKNCLATPGNILVDDRESVCCAFANRGGAVVLFPAPWNAKWGFYYRYMSDRQIIMGHVLDAIRKA